MSCDRFKGIQESRLHTKKKDEIDPEIQICDLPEMISSNLANDRKNNKEMILKILLSIRLLGNITWYPDRYILMEKQMKHLVFAISHLEWFDSHD